MALLAVLTTAAALVIGLPPVAGSPTSLVVIARPAALPSIAITFAANSSAEVESLIHSDHAYIRAGDSFDLVSGSPSTVPLNVPELNLWAKELHKEYPDAKIYEHTAGLAHYLTLAEEASPLVSGIYYDYEPGYEPEFNASFNVTLANFDEANTIALAHGLVSVGYPTGRPILFRTYKADDWNYGELADAVDQLVIQSQTYCRMNMTWWTEAVDDVLGQYASVLPPTGPTFQVTLGVNSTVTPNEVSPLQAYNCTRLLTHDGLTSLYLWWGPGANSDVLKFLRDIGRTAES